MASGKKLISAFLQVVSSSSGIPYSHFDGQYPQIGRGLIFEEGGLSAKPGSRALNFAMSGYGKASQPSGESGALNFDRSLVLLTLMLQTIMTRDRQNLRSILVFRRFMDPIRRRTITLHRQVRSPRLGTGQFPRISSQSSIPLTNLFTALGSSM